MNTNIPVLIDGKHPATLLYDRPDRATVLIEYGNSVYWMQRDRVTLPADHLATNEQPAPANAVYRGVMAERLEKRG